MLNENIGRIQRVSRVFKYLFSTLIILIPLGTLAFWLSFNSLVDGLKDLPVAVDRELPLSTLLLAFLVNMLPAGVTVYALLILRRLFTLYEEAVIFSQENARCFLRLGYALLGWVAANFVFTALISLVLTMHNGPGERALVIGFGSADLATLIIGSVVILISWVMREAAAMEHEQAYTV